MDIFSNKYKFLNDNYNGDGGYNPNCSYSYLTPHPRETTVNFNHRRNITLLTNYFKPLINLYTSPVISSNPKLITNNTALNSFFDNSNVINFVNKLIVDYKLYDQCYFGIDNENQELFKILPQDIIKLSKTGNNIDTINYMSYEDYNGFVYPVINFYSEIFNIETNSKFYRLSSATLVWRDDKGNLTLSDLGDANRVTLFDKYSNSIIMYYIGIKNIEETPDSFDIAVRNCDIFNKQSLINEILWNNAVSILCIPTDSNTDSITIGTNNILKVPSDVQKMPEFIEISPVNYDIIERSIENDKSYIYKMFTHSLLSDNVQYTTATASSISTKAFDNIVNDIYNKYKTIIEIIINSFLNYNTIVTRYSVEYVDISYTIDNINQNANNILSK